MMTILLAAKVNVAEQFEIQHPTNADLPTPRIVIKTPSRRTIKAATRSGPPGTDYVDFTLEEEGPHDLLIYFGNMLFTEVAIDSEIGASPSNVRAYGPGISGGEINIPAEFNVDTRGAGTGALGLEIEGPSEAHIECKDDSKGLCRISYLPTLPGDYIITVRFADQHIEGSPFKAVVTAKYDASRVKISGKGLHSGNVRVYDWAEAKIDCSEAGEADLFHEIIGPNGNMSQPIPSSVTPIEEGVFSLKYQPQEEGNHTIVLKYGGQNVYRSPVKVNVKPYVDVSAIKVYRFWTGNLATLICNRPTNRLHVQ